MNQDRIKYLLDRYHQNQCSDAEIKELDEWFHQQNPGHKDMERWLQETGHIDELTDDLYLDFKQRLPRSVKIVTFGRVAAVAAAVLMMMATGFWFYVNKYPDADFLAGSYKLKKGEIKHGGNKAILVLANGSKIILNNAVNGNLAVQNSIFINKVGEGKISYQTAKKGSTSDQMVYNTLITPRGGNYALTLNDGTQVILDAESSIRYPVNFNGGERRVEVMSGQAYFEVIHDAAKPFRVVVKGQTIEDIGTAFNVNAYDDEPAIKITVAEGEVKVSNPYKVLNLIPGQQAEIAEGRKNMALRQVDVEETVAWKNGWFTFHNEPIKNVMKQAARWYDVEVAYEKNVSSKRFGGSISKYKDIEELMQNLKLTGGINYEIEGRRVTLIN